MAKDKYTGATYVTINSINNNPTIVRTGANSYDLYCAERVSGTYPDEIWNIVKFSTTDSWSTSSYDGVVAGNSTDLHHRMALTENMHYTGGSTAYNGKRLLVVTKSLSSPDDHGHVKFVEI